MMSELSNPHDRFVRELSARPEAARDFLRHYLPAEAVACLDLSSVSAVPRTFVDPELRAHLADVIFRVGLREGGEANGPGRDVDVAPTGEAFFPPSF